MRSLHKLKRIDNTYNFDLRKLLLLIIHLVYDKDIPMQSQVLTEISDIVKTRSNEFFSYDTTSVEEVLIYLRRDINITIRLIFAMEHKMEFFDSLTHDSVPTAFNSAVIFSKYDRHVEKTLLNPIVLKVFSTQKNTSEVFLTDLPVPVMILICHYLDSFSFTQFIVSDQRIFQIYNENKRTFNYKFKKIIFSAMSLPYVDRCEYRGYKESVCPCSLCTITSRCQCERNTLQYSNNFRTWFFKNVGIQEYACFRFDDLNFNSLCTVVKYCKSLKSLCIYVTVPLQIVFLFEQLGALSRLRFNTSCSSFLWKNNFAFMKNYLRDLKLPKVDDLSVGHVIEEYILPESLLIMREIIKNFLAAHNEVESSFQKLAFRHMSSSCMNMFTKVDVFTNGGTWYLNITNLIFMKIIHLKCLILKNFIEQCRQLRQVTVKDIMFPCNNVHFCKVLRADFINYGILHIDDNVLVEAQRTINIYADSNLICGCLNRTVIKFGELPPKKLFRCHMCCPANSLCL